MKTKPVFIRRLLVLAVAVLLGVLCGAIVGSGTAFFYPVFAMPLLGVFGVGMGMSKAIHWCRVSRAWVATLLATVGTLVLMSTALMMGYAIQRAGIVQEIEATHGLSEDTARRYVDEQLAERTGGHSGLLAPIWFRVYDGVRITQGFQLDATPIGNGIVLLGEWALAIFLGVRMVRRRAQKPFCDACGDWYTRRILGTAPLGSLATIQGTLVDQQFHRLGRRLDAPMSDQPVVVHAGFCLQCETGSVIVEIEVTDERNRHRLVGSVTAPYAALDDILDSQALSSTKMGAAL